MKLTARRKRLTIAYMVDVMSMTLFLPPAVTSAGEPMINLVASDTTLIPGDITSPDSPSNPGDTTEPAEPETSSPDQPPTPGTSSPDQEPRQPTPEDPVTTQPTAPSTSAPNPTTPKPQERQAPSAALLAGCQAYPPTTFQVCGRIKDKYNQTGGPSGFLLFPKSNELTNPGNTGKRSEFLGGNIYWSAATDAHPVAHEFLTKWGEKGYESGYLKYPTTDEVILSDGVNRRQEYQGGSIYWAAGIGSHTIQGAIKDKWIALGGFDGPLGFPTSDEKVAPDGIGRYNTFQHGAIYWKPATGAHGIVGQIYTAWANAGYEAGFYGYPTGETVIDENFPEGASQQFEHGMIYSYAWAVPVDGNGCTASDPVGCRMTTENSLAECRAKLVPDDAQIAIYSNGVRLICRDYREKIVPSHFPPVITPQDEHDFLQCTANAIVFGQDWPDAQQGDGRTTSNTSGTRGRVIIRGAEQGVLARTVYNAFTTGDGKDWGGCVRDSTP
ncbi:LGFP repeat-containing protein [Gordonia asplenii]|uniref:LGFP repeat-containing protein n=1 Tax=Gordonia asplenii TaxID=2725283 RepID=UPI001FEB88F5|nr:hypothetical protein [Gordonia asplenii]